MVLNFEKEELNRSAVLYVQAAFRLGRAVKKRDIRREYFLNKFINADMIFRNHRRLYQQMALDVTAHEIVLTLKKKLNNHISQIFQVNKYIFIIKYEINKMMVMRNLFPNQVEKPKQNF